MESEKEKKKKRVKLFFTGQAENRTKEVKRALNVVFCNWACEE